MKEFTFTFLVCLRLKTTWKNVPKTTYYYLLIILLLLLIYFFTQKTSKRLILVKTQFQKFGTIVQTFFNSKRESKSACSMAKEDKKIL